MRVLAIDPEAEQIELSLLRMLRVTGSHAAAAEQYAHYSHALRGDEGCEPPPLRCTHEEEEGAVSDACWVRTSG